MKKTLLILLLFMPISLFSQNLDIEILRAINSPQALPSDGFFRVMSNSDIYVITITPIAAGVFELTKGNDKSLHHVTSIVGATIFNLGITTGLKYVADRTRPFVTYPDIVNKSGKKCNDPSFPSGHTSTSFALATSLSLEYPKWYVIAPAYAYAGTVAYSRMHLGVHYPTDVLAGAIIGSGCAYLSHIVNKKLYGKTNGRKVYCNGN
jgi:membrane-associated phospholipid phosphatase